MSLFCQSEIVPNGRCDLGSLNSVVAVFSGRAAYIFLLSKSIDDAQSFHGYVLSTKLLFHIRFSSASRANPPQEGLW